MEHGHPSFASQPRAQPHSHGKGPLDFTGSSRAGDFDTLERHSGCSCLAQERKQKTLSGWQHWFLSKLFSFAILSLIHLLCHTFTANGTKSYYKYHPWLSVHPTNAISRFAESHTRQVRVPQQPFLYSLQDCILSSVYYLLMVNYVPVWRVCLKLITGLLGWGAAPRPAGAQLMHRACE